jgi:crotonobetainyl-CoA:carnitine CoA-transferase CaiB-like acyl-CoA transferase
MTRSAWRRWHTLPLADVRVIAVEQFGAGPWATLQLADLGAEVIKVEDPASGGDVGRYVPPFQEGESSLFFETFNRNKKSVSLNLRHPRARGVFEDLVRACHVVYSNLRGDQPQRLGLTYDQLKHANRQIVCCSLSGFGMTGPRAKEGGYDYMMQGLAGWMSLTGDPDGPPTKSGISLVDLSAGYASVIAVLAGLWRARRDGVGCDCDVSLFETALHELIYVGTWAASRGYVPPRRRNSAHASIVPFQNFPTADGWIVVACPKQKFWALLCDAMGQPELADRFPTFADRDRQRDELVPILERAFSKRPTAEWLRVLGAAGVPSAPVNDVRDAIEDARLIEYEHQRLGTVRQVASPLKLSDAETPVRPAPERGEHTEQVLVELCGYARERVRELADAGVFGDRAKGEVSAETGVAT